MSGRQFFLFFLTGDAESADDDEDDVDAFDVDGEGVKIPSFDGGVEDFLATRYKIVLCQSRGLLMLLAGDADVKTSDFVAPSGFYHRAAAVYPEAMIEG